MLLSSTEVLLLVGAPLRAVTVKLDEKLKRRMASLAINWSEYIRQAIIQRIESEERKKAAAKLLEGLQRGRHRAPRGFINQTIREMRRTR